jgi:hypothetical protein
MTLTLIERFQAALEDKNQDVVPCQTHAPVSAGNVVQIAYATGIAAAPSDNDRLGLFGVILEDNATTGSIVAAQIRGVASIMTGDTSAIGTFCEPMSDMMVNGMSTQTDGNGFCKLLETGIDGTPVQAIIVNQ